MKSLYDILKEAKKSEEGKEGINKLFGNAGKSVLKALEEDDSEEETDEEDDSEEETDEED